MLENTSRKTPYYIYSKIRKHLDVLDNEAHIKKHIGFQLETLCTHAQDGVV